MSNILHIEFVLFSWRTGLDILFRLSGDKCPSLSTVFPYLIWIILPKHDLSHNVRKFMCGHVHTTKSQSQLVHLHSLIIISYAGLGDSVQWVSKWWSGGCGFDPHQVSNILSWRLHMKYFLWSFYPIPFFRKGSCKFLAKECAQILVNRLED